MHYNCVQAERETRHGMTLQVLGSIAGTSLLEFITFRAAIPFYFSREHIRSFKIQGSK